MFVTHSPMALPMEALGLQFLKVGGGWSIFYICDSYVLLTLQCIVKDLDWTKNWKEMLFIFCQYSCCQESRYAVLVSYSAVVGVVTGNSTGNDIIDIR